MTRIGIAGAATLALLSAGGASAGSPPVHALLTFHGRGQVVVTSDARHWRDVTPRRVIGSMEMATFVGSKHGWVVSGDCAEAKGGLARTADGGHTWTSRRFLVTGCHAGAGVAVHFLDPRFGWAEQVDPAAPYDALYTTKDGGLTWRLVVHDLPSLGPVAFRTTRDAWLGGPLLARSRNGGRTWRRVRLAIPPGTGPVELPGTGFFPPRFFGRRALVVGGFARGKRLVVRSFATADTGDHWSPRGGFSAPWRNGTFPYVWSSSPAPGVAWVAAFGTRVVARTTDGGRSWTTHALRVRGAGSIGQLVALDARTAIVQTFPQAGVLTFVTNDGGATWRRAPV